MKTKNALCGIAMAVALQLGVLAGSAQTNIYLYSGSETNITLPPGTYIITAYGAPGGGAYYYGGGDGAEMSAEFNFSTPTNLTLLVGGGGGYPYDLSSGGGGGGSFVVNGSTPLVIAGGGGGWGGFSGRDQAGGDGQVSTNGGLGVGHIFFVKGNGGYSIYSGGTGGTNGGGGAGGLSDANTIDEEGLSDGGGGGGDWDVPGYYGGGGGGGGSIIESAITILTEVSGITSPDDPANGEIIIIALPPPLTIIADGANVVLTWPAADTGFTTNGYRVESATNMVAPVAWQTNSAAPIVIGGQNVVIIPISGSQQFFRLH